MPFDPTPITLPEIIAATQPDPVTEVLKAARERLLTSGWTRASFHNDAGYCALGAIYDSPRNGEMRTDSISEVHLLAVGRLQLTIARRLIPMWNDSRWRTKEEVIAAFDRAIDYRL